MHITLQNAGKRFNRDWIFRNFNYTFLTGNSYTIIGPNGSGKSTLLQVIAGAINLNEGKIEFKSIDHGPSSIVNLENIYQYISLCAPSVEVIEEMTAKEFLSFHQNFKPFLPNITIAEILANIELQTSSEKQIRYFSSGMKQRIKLAQAIFSDTPILLLDEPCTNLDEDGFVLYHQLIEKYCNEKLIIIASNDVLEYDFCKEKILMSDYKK